MTDLLASACNDGKVHGVAGIAIFGVVMTIAIVSMMVALWRQTR